MRQLLAIRSLTMLLVVILCDSNALAQDAQPQERVFSNDEVGFTVTLPDDSWKMTDHSQGKAKVYVFSPQENLSTRCSVLRLPKAFAPEGILTREKQIKTMAGAKYERVSLRDDKLADQAARRLEYLFGGLRTVEWEIADKDSIFIFQLAAPKEDWNDPNVETTLNALRDSLIYSERNAASGELPPAKMPLASEVREKRRAQKNNKPGTFELSHHQVDARIDPSKHALEVTDQLTIRARSDQLTEIPLYVSGVKIDNATGFGGLKWELEPLANNTEGVEVLTLSWPQPLSRGQEITVTVTTSSDDFLLTTDQKLVVEIGVLAQVRERSSYSSHAFYYPIDKANDASVDIALTVPQDYVAVTGGKLAKLTERPDGLRTYRYITDQRRRRLLPFGFAVGKYIHQSGTSDGGLTVTVYGYEGEEKLLAQRVSVAMEAANAFERLMGPLPWKDVRIAHVTPVEKETGVSLPGLILISDSFFTDFSDVDFSDGNLQNLDGLSLLVVADELSHQWNAYAAPLPNELAEGISTFTNALFIERRHGREAFRKTVRALRLVYMQSTALGCDVAVADPDIYSTSAYRGIVFCKTPVALAMLRERIGDEKFFAAWRSAFGEFSPGTDGFDVVEQAFSNEVGEDLTWFFDQWFFQAGWPKVTLEYVQDGKGLHVTVHQHQTGPAYRVRGMLSARDTEDQEQRFVVELTGKETRVTLECPFEATEVVFDPDHDLLVETLER